MVAVVTKGCLREEWSWQLGSGSGSVFCLLLIDMKYQNLLFSLACEPGRGVERRRCPAAN